MRAKTERCLRKMFANSIAVDMGSWTGCLPFLRKIVPVIKNMIRVYTTELEQTWEHSWGTICIAIFSDRLYSIPTMAIRHPPHTYKKVVLFGIPCSVWGFSSRGPSTDPRELLPIRCHLLQAGFRVTLYSHLPVPYAAQLSVCSLGGHLPSR